MRDVFRVRYYECDMQQVVYNTTEPPSMPADVASPMVATAVRDLLAPR